MVILGTKPAYSEFIFCSPLKFTKTMCSYTL